MELGRYVVVYPANNPSVAEGCARYRAVLVDESSFSSVTVEELFEADVLPPPTVRRSASGTPAAEPGQDFFRQRASRRLSGSFDLLRPAVRLALGVEERQHGPREIGVEEDVVVREVGQDREAIG